MNEFKIGSLVVEYRFGRIYQIDNVDDLIYVKNYPHDYEIYTNEFVEE